MLWKVSVMMNILIYNSIYSRHRAIFKSIIVLKNVSAKDCEYFLWSVLKPLNKAKFVEATGSLANISPTPKPAQQGSIL